MPHRVLKDSIVTSCEIEKLTWPQEVFFYRLLVSCDDYGRHDARPEVLRSRCYPLRLNKVSALDVSGYLGALTSAGLVQVYIVEDKPYLQVRKWHLHQRIRAAKSKCPGPPADICCQMPADDGANNTPPLKTIKDTTGKYETGDGVFLSSKETEELLQKLGETRLNELIDAISLYQHSKGIKYKSHYHTILNWARRDEKNIQKPVQKTDPDKYLRGKYGHMVQR